jgi:hypothetical protein
MPTPRKPGGYIDNAELARAIRANKRARAVLARILNLAGQRRGSSWLYHLLAELAQAHSEGLEALTEMENIRAGEVTRDD